MKAKQQYLGMWDEQLKALLFQYPIGVGLHGELIDKFWLRQSKKFLQLFTRSMRDDLTELYTTQANKQ